MVKRTRLNNEHAIQFYAAGVNYLLTYLCPSKICLVYAKHMLHTCYGRLAIIFRPSREKCIENMLNRFLVHFDNVLNFINANIEPYCLLD